MTSKYFVYALVDPRTKAWRYIGKTCRGRKRLIEHSAPSYLEGSRSHKSNWVRSLLNLGLMYETEVLEEFSSNDGLAEAEIEWIEEAKRQGLDLTNGTSGGEGSTGFKHSAETRARMSLAHTGSKHHMFGRQHSEETKAKIASSHVGFKGRKHSEQTLIKMSEIKQGENNPFFGAAHTEETRAKMSSAHVNKSRRRVVP